MRALLEVWFIQLQLIAEVHLGTKQDKATWGPLVRKHIGTARAEKRLTKHDYQINIENAELLREAALRSYERCLRSIRGNSIYN